MKLNIGSSCANGRYREKEWVNLDLFKSKGVNVIGSGFYLPFKDSSFDEIHSIHVLEHLTRDKFPVMLKEIVRVIKLECPVYIEVPDFEEIITLLHEAYHTENQDLIHKWRTSIYGKTERRGMAHHFGFDHITLIKYLASAGFNDLTRIINKEDMVSSHYKQEPVLLIRGRKV